ncbi:coiled-coil domain-containing protein 22 homolog [Haematobia irritans]|uniref:coiled-coil domain-containing protein 22 homolog n=1 Tax=Haematobia irritans TaxID=7368 RepID=UPI003F4FE197
MDEVDKIIIHSLNQIGCKLHTDDNDVFVLENFNPDTLAKSVALCLQEIKPEITIPSSISENMNMAQRFSVASTLADMCVASGYRGDIGYQTFLYPNVVAIRRLFMFLIEQLPKVSESTNTTDGNTERNTYTLLMRDIKSKISNELTYPWVPQYCRGMANRKAAGSSSLAVDFNPQLNLHVPQNNGVETNVKEIVYQSPNIFQQMSAGEYDLVSSVLHKCATDMHTLPHSLDGIHLTGNRTNPIQSTLKPFKVDDLKEEANSVKREETTSSPIQNLIQEVDSLKQRSDLAIEERQQYNSKLAQIRHERLNIDTAVEAMKMQNKVHERTCVILENPNENLKKLEALIDKARERRLAVENQWTGHREQALKRIDELQKLRQTKNLQNIHELRKNIQEAENSLKDKTRIHIQLAEELKRGTIDVAPRKEYTKRIYEFIENIRKQRNDIYKILDDTRDLQKQLNSVSAQLQRQFNYTDDLLFQSAKVHVHAKQAYKLLASLHVSCSAICEMVSQTGQNTKEIRDFEVQIDRERMNNVGANLEKITRDIKQFQIATRQMQEESQTMYD